ncbi:MAG: hypothetical protein Q8O61_10385 [Nocardioides sp.]|nr:hypothetical protein [Nocardioides sp.]
MELHETLYELGLTSGRAVFDDADLLRAALDDYLDEGAASTGDINLLVDAVRLGAFRMMLTTIDSGAEPTRAVEAAGEVLARDRGTSDVGATRWACAVLGFAVGKVSATDVRRFDRSATQQRPASPPPPSTRAPATPPMPPTVSPALSPTGPPPVSPAYPAAYPSPYPSAYPSGYPSSPQPTKKRNPWLVPSVVGVVLLVVGGILAAVLLAGDDKEKAGGDSPPDDPTTQPAGEQISGTGYSFALLDGWRDVTDELIAAGDAGATNLAVAWGATLASARANLVVETGFAQGESDPEELRERWESNMANATGATPEDNGTATLDGEQAIAIKISRNNENKVAIEQFGYLAIHDGDLYSVILSAEAGDEKAQDAFTDILDSWTWAS